MTIENYLLGDGHIDWKKVRGKGIEFKQDPKSRLAEVLDYLMAEGKVTDFLGANALILFKPDEWDLNPPHSKYDGSRCYFTEAGIDEARNYVKDFLNVKGVRICKAREIV